MSKIYNVTVQQTVKRTLAIDAESEGEAIGEALSDFGLHGNNCAACNCTVCSGGDDDRETKAIRVSYTVEKDLTLEKYY